MAHVLFWEQTQHAAVKNHAAFTASDHKPAENSLS